MTLLYSSAVRQLADPVAGAAGGRGLRALSGQVWLGPVFGPNLITQEWRGKEFGITSAVVGVPQRSGPPESILPSS
jgi:hypothetical protein